MKERRKTEQKTKGTMKEMTEELVEEIKRKKWETEKKQTRTEKVGCTDHIQCTLLLPRDRFQCY